MPWHGIPPNSPVPRAGAVQIPPEGEDHLFPRLLSTSPLAFSALFAPSLILMGKVKSEFNVKRSFFFFFFLTPMFPVVSTQALKNAVRSATNLCSVLPEPALQMYFAPVVLLK